MSQSAVVSSPIPLELIERRIYLIRGHKVMLDADLADLYQVATKAFNQAVKRNLDRFPDDFMFQLSPEEFPAIRSQFVTGSHRNSRFRPYAFTEQGIAMLSSVLSSSRAIHVNIAIMRTFVRLREMLITHKDLALKLGELERTQREQGADISAIWATIQDMLQQQTAPRRNFGFTD